METLDLDARYTVDGWRGIAFYLVGYEHEHDATMVRAVMVGDDRVHIIDIDDLTVIDDEDYCHECGQVGCTADGR